MVDFHTLCQMFVAYIYVLPRVSYGDVKQTMQFRDVKKTMQFELKNKLGLAK